MAAPAIPMAARSAPQPRVSFGEAWQQQIKASGWNAGGLQDLARQQAAGSASRSDDTMRSGAAANQDALEQARSARTMDDEAREDAEDAGEGKTEPRVTDEKRVESGSPNPAAKVSPRIAADGEEQGEQMPVGELAEASGDAPGAVKARREAKAVGSSEAGAGAKASAGTVQELGADGMSAVPVSAASAVPQARAAESPQAAEVRTTKIARNPAAAAVNSARRGSGRADGAGEASLRDHAAENAPAVASGTPGAQPGRWSVTPQSSATAPEAAPGHRGMPIIAPGTAGAAGIRAPQILASSPAKLDVGVFDGTHGWLRIRAEMGAGGAVSASLAASSAAHASLRAELPEMARYLASEAVSVSKLEVNRLVAGANGAPASSEQKNSEARGQGQSSGQQEAGTNWWRKPPQALQGAASAAPDFAASGQGAVYALARLGAGVGFPAAASGGWLNVCA